MPTNNELSMQSLATFVALCVYREARNQPPLGQEAIMEVIYNRSIAWYKGDLAEAIFKVNQFSSMSVLGDSQTVVWPLLETEKAQFNDLYEMAWRKSFGVQQPQVSKGALYYANVDLVPHNEWLYKNVISDPENYPMTLKIGAHTFYTTKQAF